MKRKNKFVLYLTECYMSEIAKYCEENSIKISNFIDLLIKDFLSRKNKTLIIKVKKPDENII